MKGASDKIVIFYFFFSAHPNWWTHKISDFSDPPFHVFCKLLCKYLSYLIRPKINHKLLAVWHHLKKVWMISDERWRRTNVLLLKTFDLLNFHCLTHSALVYLKVTHRRNIERRKQKFGWVYWISISIFNIQYLGQKRSPCLNFSKPQVPLRVRDGQGHSSRSRCCRRIGRDCSGKPVWLENPQRRKVKQGTSRENPFDLTSPSLYFLTIWVPKPLSFLL